MGVDLADPLLTRPLPSLTFFQNAYTKASHLTLRSGDRTVACLPLGELLEVLDESIKDQNDQIRVMIRY